MSTRIIRKFVPVALAVCVLLAASIALAGTTGKIAGNVVDKETAQPIPGAAITIVGTSLGGLTDENGRYVILSVPVGSYVVKAQLVGYTPMEVENVRVSVDLTTDINLELTSQAVEVGTIRVQAKRPLIIKDQTSSLRIVDREQIASLPTRSYQDIVGYQAGVVQFLDNADVRQRGGRESTSGPSSMSIRGGRRSEVAYFVDGFSQQDPQSGLATTQVNQNAVEEVSITTGGFTAEYGWVSSGAINVITKEGNQNYSGTIELITDNVTNRNYDYNTYAGDFSGPVPGFNDKMTFFVSGERRYYGDREPRATTEDWFFDKDGARSYELPSNRLSGYSWQGKVNMNLTQSMKLKLGFLGSQDDWSQYLHSFYFNTSHVPRYLDKNNSAYGKLVYNVNPKTFFTASVNYYNTSRKRGDGVAFDNMIDYGRPDGNFTFDETRLFYSGDNPETPSQADHALMIDDDYGFGYITVQVDTTDAGEPVFEDIVVQDERGYMRNGRSRDSVRAALADGDNPWVSDLILQDENGVMYADENWVWEDFTKRESSYWGFKSDITSQVHPNHEVKTGVEYQYHTLKYYRHLFPHMAYKDSVVDGVWYDNGGYDDVDHYGYDIFGNESDTLSEGNEARHPYQFAYYLQDKFEWEGLVVNAGLRFDYLNVNTKRLKFPDTPLGDPNDNLSGDDSVLDPTDLEDAKAETKLSPRLGFGFPISDKTTFHLSYGKFFQRPDLQNLYVGWDYMNYRLTSAGYYYAFGNPNLKPEKTTAYEIGMTKQVGDYTRLDFTAYYKDVEDLTQVSHQAVQQGASGRDFDLYVNSDFGTVKGLEMTLNMRRNRSVALDLNYSLSWATGTGSWATTQRNIAWTVSDAPKSTSPLDFDQRHKLSASVDIRAGKGEGPQLGEWYPFENAGINFHFGAASGTPYSPMDIFNEVTLAAISPVPDGAINSEYGPWTYRLDLKANKVLNFGKYDLDVYIWVLNVLDRKNEIDVYESSGQVNSTGWLTTPDGRNFIETYEDADYTGYNGLEKYNIKQNNPNSYDIPRQIRFGVKVSI